MSSSEASDSAAESVGETIDPATGDNSEIADDTVNSEITDDITDSEVTDSRIGDELPDDLQPHLVDPEDYVFPNNNRRRVPGYLYLAIAAGLGLLVLTQGDSAFVNSGLLGAAAILVVIGAYSIISGSNLNIDERDALVASVGEVGFPVGHAAAQMGWRGLLSRPTWRVLLYSAEEPPERRGFVLVDGVDGRVIDSFTEANPEDWAEMAE